MNKCDCDERNGIDVSSLSEFKELKTFFKSQVASGEFEDAYVQEPYHTYIGPDVIVKRYATKWYRCRICGCLWEFKYPDFPTHGFVHKFKDGKHVGERAEHGPYTLRRIGDEYTEVPVTSNPNKRVEEIRSSLHYNAQGEDYEY